MAEGPHLEDLSVPRSHPMKKYFIAGVLVVAFTAPSLAADYYVALRLGGGAARCEVMTTEPDTKTYKMMGKYSSEAAAKAAMATMKECGG
jgi:hypothetical protein